MNKIKKQINISRLEVHQRHPFLIRAWVIRLCLEIEGVVDTWINRANLEIKSAKTPEKCNEIADKHYSAFYWMCIIAVMELVFAELAVRIIIKYCISILLDLQIFPGWIVLIALVWMCLESEHLIREKTRLEIKIFIDNGKSIEDYNRFYNSSRREVILKMSL